MTWIPLNSQVMVMAQRPLRWPLAIGKGLTSLSRAPSSRIVAATVASWPTRYTAPPPLKREGPLKKRGTTIAKMGQKKRMEWVVRFNAAPVMPFGQELAR